MYFLIATTYYFDASQMSYMQLKKKNTWNYLAKTNIENIISFSHNKYSNNIQRNRRKTLQIIY